MIYDLTGYRFGRLTVLRKSDDYLQKELSNIKWHCICDCGNEVDVRSFDLRRGRTKSCGCLHKDIVSKHGELKNGTPKSRLYQIWIDMRSRCNNKNLKCYHNYGGRGIKICDEWNEFKNFSDWSLINGYSDLLTIDRIDVNGNYEPDNCRWVTKKEQENNRRNNICDCYNGEMMTMMQFSEKINKSFSAISYKFHKNNMSFEEIAKYFEDNDAMCIDINNCNNSLTYSIQNNKRHGDIMCKIRKLLNEGKLSENDALLKNYITVQNHYRKCFLLSENAITILNKERF